MSIWKSILHPSRIVEAGRRMAISGALYLAAGGFAFAATIIASLELGNQLANGAGLHASGLWNSALIVAVLAAVSAGAGRFITVRHSNKKELESDEVRHRVPVIPT